MNFLEAEKEFKRRCMALNLANETLGIYKKCLHRLLDTCIEEELGNSDDTITVNDITVSLMRYHFAKLLKQIQPITVRIHYRCLHTFFYILVQRGIHQKKLYGSGGKATCTTSRNTGVLP